MELLIEYSHSEVLTQPGAGGCSLLHLASRSNGSIDVLRLLLQACQLFLFLCVSSSHLAFRLRPSEAMKLPFMFFGGGF
eukprot:COSAG01_NODE_8352_length_2825_cov_19.830147_2_plen_79_part_00